MTKNELYHHGILGMKWGVRRYQNPDGSLTEAGKRRYESESKDVETYGRLKGELHRLNREIGVYDPNFTKTNHIVPKDVLSRYREGIKLFSEFDALLDKKYGDALRFDKVKMDDGLNYLTVCLNDPMIGEIQYFVDALSDEEFKFYGL